MSKNHLIRKVNVIVGCLCRIHNWLIDESPRVGGALYPPPHTNEDTVTHMLNGAVGMELRTNNEHGAPPLPLQLLDGGDHFDDDPDQILRKRISRMYDNTQLPRENMCTHVAELHLRRPQWN